MMASADTASESASVPAGREMQQREAPESCILTAAEPDQSVQPILASPTVKNWQANGGQDRSMEMTLCLQWLTRV